MKKIAFLVASASVLAGCSGQQAQEALASNSGNEENVKGNGVQEENGEAAGNSEENNESVSDDSDEIAEADSIEELFERVANNSPTSERIQALEEIAMYYYWHGGDVLQAEEEVFEGITLHGDYDVVEEAFRQATEIDPYDTDLMYSLASAQILQQEIDEALHTYERMLNMEEDHFEAQLMHAIYSGIEGDDEAFESGMEALDTIDEERAASYRENITSVEEIQELSFNTEVPEDLPDENHAFVVLGYALSDEGEMEETLLERLKVAKEAAEQNPDSKLIVSGGVPRQGITEADVMHEWLIEEGIEEDRIIKEDMATDTVENGLFSMQIAEEEQIEDITMITSASHMRRALVIFEEVDDYITQKNGSDVERDFSHVVYLDYDSVEEAETFEREEEIVVYRDLMRATGIWAYPGLQR
ncbi:ElyC/SanA/YdcF family protein [Alkalicoccus saliphilus]|uniref:DUF218 domain-containing protein n=1 Tax=Alkalicoccus saliphilus TaxID=200989 RepID=A0A2T4U6V3_9BACI|nr:ElyC/SanA/YdcF family protein [Alkalicoccus saliphilus]PTL39129.1 hypothetical protein C6Y45_08095 [Alkalicoccus saliphilus]